MDAPIERELAPGQGADGSGDVDREESRRVSLAVLTGVAGFVLGGCVMAIVLLWTTD